MPKEAFVGDKSDRVRGKAKEAAGRLTGNPQQEQEGRTEQSLGDLKKAGEKVKDAVKRQA